MNKIIKYILFIIPFFSIITLLNSSIYVNFWLIAYYLLLFIMFSRPIRDIFPKTLKTLDKIVRIRKELWIIVWFFAIAHVTGYFLDNGLSYTYFFNSGVWAWDSYLTYWIIGIFVTIPLLLTSNIFSVKKLWKYWKKIQYLAYVMTFAVILHVALINRSEFINTISIWVLYLFVLILSAYLNKRRLKSSTSIKYICVPCWYIYDEELWDPDSWIEPWTSFEDIPDTWVCPVCWASKWDFVIYEWNIKKEFIDWVIKKVEYINKKNDVISLVLELKNLTNLPKRGQFMSFNFTDNDWDFVRSYSVSEVNWNNFTFLIKLSTNSRSWKILSKVNPDETIKVTWPFWNFWLAKSDNDKLFIATWTWLAPIYNMIYWLKEHEKKTLLFWVSTKDDLFYVDKLSSIKNLDLHIFLSREDKESLPSDLENVKYYNSRIDFEKIWEINKTTEIYVCWNPIMITSMVDNLKNKGYNNIILEKF